MNINRPLKKVLKNELSDSFVSREWLVEFFFFSFINIVEVVIAVHREAAAFLDI